MTDQPTNTDVLGCLSILDDLTGILHGKGGVEKIVYGLDIVNRIAQDVALATGAVPGLQPIAGAAGVASAVIGTIEVTLGNTQT